MPVKVLAVIVLALFLSGCATTKKGNNIEIQQLKGRVTTLETDLQAKEQAYKAVIELIDLGYKDGMDMLNHTVWDPHLKKSIRLVDKLVGNV